MSILTVEALRVWLARKTSLKRVIRRAEAGLKVNYRGKRLSTPAPVLTLEVFRHGETIGRGIYFLAHPARITNITI